MASSCTFAVSARASAVACSAAGFGGARRSAGGILCLSLLCLLACARAPSFDLDGSPAGGPREVLQRIHRNALLMNSLRADVRLTSEHMPQSRLARADLLFARPHRYRVQFKTVFGNTMAVFIVRQGRADLYLPMSNRLYQGDLTARGIRELVGIELSAGDLLETLSGIFHLPSDAELLDYQRAGNDHLLIFPWGQGRREIRVASDGVRILSDRYRDASGRPVLEKEFQGYRMIDGVVLPEEVRAFLPERQEKLEVYFSHQAVDTPWEEEDFHLDLPDGVERLPWIREYR